MIRLPELFPHQKMSVIDRMQIEWFYSKYTEEYYNDYAFGHFLMAAYAAVPAYLTPDLLYKLWQNFGKYQWQGKSEFIHSISVNDILLAPFCHEVSYELFKMEEETRLAFLKWMTSDDLLWQSLQAHPIVEVAEFVESYLNHPNETMVREGARYRDEQLMEVKVYKDPQAVAAFYLENLKNAVEAKREHEILLLINNLKKAIKKESYTGYTNATILGNLFRDNELDLWKNVIQQNNSAIASLLEQLSQNPEDGSLIQVKGNTHSHAIHIKQTETSLVNRFDALVNPINYAIIIGCSAEDTANCQLFEKTLKAFPENDGWKINTLSTPYSKEELFQQLKTITATVTGNDNLLIYLSAPWATYSKSGNCDFLYHGSHITDIEFNRIITDDKNEMPASLTMVINCDHAATHNWLNTNKPGCALFAATSIDATRLTGDLFTNAFCSTLAKYGGNVSNRQLYVETIDQLDRPEWKAPCRLHSNRNTYYRKFASNEVPQVLLQHNLRLSGFLDKVNSLEWDQLVQTALEEFAKDHKLDAGAPNIAELVRAGAQANENEKKPLLLFIFSEDKRLQSMANEMRAVRTDLRKSIVNEYTEIKVFQNRPLKEVNDFVRNEISRNRIQLIYFSGFDEEGFPRFPDGKIDLPLWNEWLSWHNSMEMVVLNTCKSELLASRLVQMGVKTAIGVNGMVSDTEGAEFGVDLINAIAQRKNLSTLQMQKG